MTRKVFLILLCSLLTVSLTAGAQKKKGGGGKNKGGKQGGQQGGQQNQGQGQGQSQPPQGGASQEPPPAAVSTVDRRLWEYKTSEARSAVSPIAGQAESNAHVAVALGRVLDQEQKYEEAVAQLRKATELAPSDPAAYLYLGETYLRGRSGDADGAFRRAAELAQAGNGGREANYILGVAQQRLRQFDQAVATLEKARQSDPGDARVPFQIGVTRVFQEQWQPALDQLNRALEMDSGLAYGYYYRGLAAEKIGRKDLLVNDLERFIALAPNAPEAERARAVLRAAKR